MLSCCQVQEVSYIWFLEGTFQHHFEDPLLDFVKQQICLPEILHGKHICELNVFYKFLHSSLKRLLSFSLQVWVRS